MTEETPQMIRLSEEFKYIKEAMDRNFEDHKEIKKMFKEGLDKKVSFSRYKVVELIAYALAGSTLIWTLNQVLQTISTVKALF